MKTIIATLILIVFSTGSSYAQIKAETPQAKLENDIKNNKVTLYILGGIAARVYKEDAEFMEKYHVAFHDFGCLAPPNLDFYRDYNQLVFAYLNNQYGTGWQTEVRKDILGWEKRKEEKK